MAPRAGSAHSWKRRVHISRRRVRMSRPRQRPGSPQTGPWSARSPRVVPVAQRQLQTPAAGVATVFGARTHARCFPARGRAPGHGPRDSTVRMHRCERDDASLAHRTRDDKAEAIRKNPSRLFCQNNSQRAVEVFSVTAAVRRPDGTAAASHRARGHGPPSETCHQRQTATRGGGRLSFPRPVSDSDPVHYDRICVIQHLQTI